MLQHDRPDLLRSKGALELLPSQQLLLDVLPRFRALRLHKSFSTLTVAPSEAGGDEVGHTAALQEGAVLHAWVEVADEGGHLLQPDSDDSRLRVAAETYSVAEASPKGHHVLEGATEFHARNVRYRPHAEGWAVEELDQELLVLLRRVGAQGGLAELLVGDLVSHVGAHEHRDVVFQQPAQDVRAQAHLAALELETALDEADRHCALFDWAHARDCPRHELVRQYPHIDVRSLRGLLQIRLGADVVWQHLAW
mmetsp:Transcript_91901/g.256706  ORF Transcript_91901/g.256706 Transcript_91901/m.256706 type:complete len:252 (+) Transcript_91901:604-1359(+)